MPVIIRNLPFFEKHTTAHVRGETVRIKPYQVILWVSVLQKGVEPLPRNTIKFPAILDLGHSHNFSIREEHLARWGGYEPGHLEQLGSIHVAGQRLPLLDANVYIHPNRPANRDDFSNQEPFLIELDSGIAVYTKDSTHSPRLPLLGLRGLRRADLQLHVDCQKCFVSIRTPRRFFLF